MKKDIIPDSSKVISTFTNKYAVHPGAGGSPIKQMPPMGMQPMPPMGMQPMPPMGMQPMPPMGMQPMPPMGMPPMMQPPRVPAPVNGPPVLGPNYIQGYMKQFIGDYVRIDFLVGTGTFIDRDGILMEVGVDYVVLREVQTGNTLIGDLYSIKFVTVYTGAPGQPAL